MNAKTLLATLALTLGTGSVFAVEATQFVPGPSTLDRTTVRAELARADAAGELNQRGETYGSFKASDIHSSHTNAQAASRNHMPLLSRAANRDYIGG